jgi:GAF domain-containing protein
MLNQKKDLSDDVNSQLEKSTEQHAQDLESRLVQIRTAAEVTQLAISASNQGELLRRTVELIVDRFGYYQASIFLVDESQEFALLTEASGVVGKELVAKGLRIDAGSRSMIGWVMANRKPRVAANVNEESYYQQDERLADIRSEASIPMIIGDQLVGVLDIQHTQVNVFDEDVVAILKIMANSIASVLQNFRLLESTRNNLNELSSIYKASHQLGRAVAPEEVTQITASTLGQSPYFTGFFRVEREGLKVISMHEADLAGWGFSTKSMVYPSFLAIPNSELEPMWKEGEAFAIVDSILDPEQVVRIPEALLSIPRQSGYKSLALIPGHRDGKLDILFLLGSRKIGSFSADLLQPYASLADMTTTALDKVYTAQRLEKRLAALQILNAISQAVSVETDLNALYQVIHREVSDVMGVLNFAIATYDARSEMITIPYMFDGETVTRVDPFPLGQGLTSILIRTKQPLMIVYDTERRTRELGAILVGKPAKSWLGVPLLVAGEVIGAILLQDLEQEGRFDEDDQRLLVTLASQVAVAIRNTRLLESTYRQAAHERLLFDITNKIRSSSDISAILETTARELGMALGSQRTTIELGVDSASSADNKPLPEPDQAKEGGEESDADISQPMDINGAAESLPTGGS